MTSSSGDHHLSPRSTPHSRPRDAGGTARRHVASFLAAIRGEGPAPAASSPAAGPPTGRPRGGGEAAHDGGGGVMPLDPAGLEAAAKALGEVYGGRMAEDAPAAEAAVSAYLAAVVPVTCPECGTEVPPRYSPEASGWYCGGCARPVARDPVPVTPTTENPTARQVLAEAFDGVIHHACGPDDWAAGHALDALAAAGFSVVAGRAAATPDPRNGCRAPHCFSEYGTPCGSCPVAEKPETDT